jgi:hypothetical protein
MSLSGRQQLLRFAEIFAYSLLADLIRTSGTGMDILILLTGLAGGAFALAF